MFIISEVPERGSPDTTITGAEVEAEAGIASISHL
jgi:hypothetical protein